MSEETSVGSIVGRLRLDSSEWNADLARAEARARELGNADPTIRVHADTAQAETSLAAVAAAERRVGDETEHETVRRRENTSESRNNAAANQHNANTLRLLVAALVAVAPAALPIAAAAVAGTVALAGMGAAGLLAVVGVKNAMQDGSAIGNQYAAGIGVLKDDLDELAGTAAAATLQGFNSGVENLQSHLPEVNREVDIFGRMLGASVSNGLAGMLNGLETLFPVAEQFGAYLEGLSERFRNFGQSQGLKDFASYAMDELPQVETTIEAVVTAVGHLLQGMAPLGGVALTSIKVVADVLNSLPLDAITVLVPALSGAYAGFMLFKNVIPVLQALGAAEDVALGPIGLIVAGVGLLAGALIGATAATDNNTSSVMSFTTALEQNNGVIDESIAKIAAKNLLDNGAADAAKTLGINLGEVTQAALGNSSAQSDLTDKINAAKSAYDNSAIAVDDFGNITHLVTQDVQNQYDAANKLDGAWRNTADGLRQAQQNQQDVASATQATTAAAAAQHSSVDVLAASTHIGVGAYLAAAEAQEKDKAKLDATTASMQMQNDAGGLLKMTLDKLNGKAISAAQAQNTFDSAIANSDKHINAAGKTINRASTSLTGMSAAAVQNRTELTNQVTALEAVAEANRNNGASTDATRNKMIAMRTEIINNAVAHGEDRAAVSRYIDKLFQIPHSIPPTKLDVDTANAHAKANALQAAIDAMHGKTVVVDVVTNSVSAQSQVKHMVHGPEAFADGGMVGGARHLADGGWSDVTLGGLMNGPGTTRSDSIPVMASLNEFMVKASSVRSIGPENLEYMNRTGRLVAQAVPVPAPGPQNITVYVTNPFTGEQVLATVQAVADQRVGAWVDDQNRRRVGV